MHILHPVSLQRACGSTFDTQRLPTSPDRFKVPSSYVCIFPEVLGASPRAHEKASRDPFTKPIKSDRNLPPPMFRREHKYQ